MGKEMKKMMRVPSTKRRVVAHSFEKLQAIPLIFKVDVNDLPINIPSTEPHHGQKFFDDP
jgi:hypothetical protein